MKKRRLIELVILCFAVAAMILLSTQLSSAQNGNNGKKNGDSEGPPPPLYNPYPSGILPADLDSEIARVLREWTDRDKSFVKFQLIERVAPSHEVLRLLTESVGLPVVMGEIGGENRQAS